MEELLRVLERATQPLPGGRNRPNLAPGRFPPRGDRNGPGSAQRREQQRQERRETGFQQLRRMGFTAAQARPAIEATDGNVAAAVNRIIDQETGMRPRDPPRQPRGEPFTFNRNNERNNNQPAPNNEPADTPRARLLRRAGWLAAIDDLMDELNELSPPDDWEYMYLRAEYPLNKPPKWVQDFQKAMKPRANLLPYAPNLAPPSVRHAADRRAAGRRDKREPFHIRSLACMCDFNFKPRPIYIRRSYLFLVKEKPPKAWRDGPAFWAFGPTPLMVAQRKLAFACMFRNRNTRPLGRAPSYPLPRITDMDVAMMIGEACVAENPRQTARDALQDLGKDRFARWVQAQWNSWHIRNKLPRKASKIRIEELIPDEANKKDPKVVRRQQRQRRAFEQRREDHVGRKLLRRQQQRQASRQQRGGKRRAAGNHFQRVAFSAKGR